MLFQRLLTMGSESSLNNLGRDLSKSGDLNLLRGWKERHTGFQPWRCRLLARSAQAAFDFVLVQIWPHLQNKAFGPDEVEGHIKVSWLLCPKSANLSLLTFLTYLGVQYPLDIFSILFDFENPLFYSHLFIYFVCVCVYACATQWVWRSDGILRRLTLSVYHVGLGCELR